MDCGACNTQQAKQNTKEEGAKELIMHSVGFKMEQLEASTVHVQV